MGQGVPGGTVTLVEGSTFCISEAGGDVAHGQLQGLFVRDMRVLSRWALAIDGADAEATDHAAVRTLRRHIHRSEAAVPDLIEELAVTTNCGMPRTERRDLPARAW